jgi:adenosine deaminase
MLTGVAQRDEPHPLVELDAAGCIVTIDADDPALFGTTIVDEYAYVADILGLGTLLRFAANGIDASFAAPERKAALHRRLELYRHHVGS